MKLFVCPPKENLWDTDPYIYKMEGFCVTKDDICCTKEMHLLADCLRESITDEINQSILEKIRALKL